MIIIPGDDGANRVLGASGLDDEPEQHVDHVDKPDSLRGGSQHLGEEDNQTIHHVEIETVTKHELPEVAGLRLVGAVRPPDCQNQLNETMIEFRRISVDTIAELTEAV